MKRPITIKREEEQYSKVDPSLLECVTTVYGDKVYIRTDRKGGGLIPMYRADGTPILEKSSNEIKSWWGHTYLHPDNILTPFSPPMSGDYLQLLDAQGKPSENHTEIFTWTAELGQHLYLIEDMDGESFAATRLPELDTQKRRAWQQVLTATG